MTVLSIVQETCDLLSLPRPLTVFSSTDLNVRLLTALLKEEIEELHTFDWQRLIREHTFVTVAAAEQTNGFPDDARRLISGSFFNRTTRRPLRGPISPQEWQAIQAQPVAASAYIAWRERDDAFLVTPTPAAGETIAYEYITRTKAIAEDDEEKNDISADTDTILVAESLVRLGLRWRFRQAKGLDYAEDMATYERKKHNARAVNGSASPTLNIGRGGNSGLSLGANIQDGDWPSA